MNNTFEMFSSKLSKLMIESVTSNNMAFFVSLNQRGLFTRIREETSNLAIKILKHPRTSNSERIKKSLQFVIQLNYSN